MLKADWNDEDYLMNEFREGNTEAFRFIYDANHRTLLQFAHHLIFNEEDAKDMVADAFIKGWERRHSFENLINIRSFLFIITKNACLDYIKEHKRRQSLHKEILYLAPKQEEYMQAQMIKADLIQKMMDEMMNMPPAMKEICKLIFIDGLDNPEIAEKLKISEHTVRVQKARALKYMRRGFTDKGSLFLWGPIFFIILFH